MAKWPPKLMLAYRIFTSWVVQTLSYFIDEPHSDSVAGAWHQRSDYVIPDISWEHYQRGVDLHLQLNDAVVETDLFDWTKEGGIFFRTLKDEEEKYRYV